MKCKFRFNIEIEIKIWTNRFLNLSIAYFFDKSFIKNDYSKIFVSISISKVDENSHGILIRFIWAILIRLDIDLMDKKFSNYGILYYDLIKSKKTKQLTKDEIDFLIDSFSIVVLKNISFSNENLFQNQNIIGIEYELQVKMILNGMYFRLLPQISLFQDLNFKFK